MAVDTSSSILLSGNEKFAYTPEELALTTPDGRVLVFDAKNGVRKTEFVPTSHLSAAATCLAWKPWSEAGKSPNKK